MGVLIMDPANNPMGESPPFTREELEAAAKVVADAAAPDRSTQAGYDAWQAAYTNYFAPAGLGYADMQELVKYEVDPDKYRWRYCRFLSEWCVDGVLVSNEHEHTKDPMVGKAASHPGEALNICIGGPTPMRNSDWGEFPQHFDDGVRVLDKVFVGLVATENRDAANVLTHFSYQFKLFTSRQLAWTQFLPSNAFPARPLPPTEADITGAVALLPAGDRRKVEGSEEYNAFIATVGTDPHASSRNRPVYAHDDRYQPGANNRLGPSKEDFVRMVDVWRVGSIMDSRAGMMPYKCAVVNVVVERWTPEQCAEEYNEFFGKSFALERVPDMNIDDIPGQPPGNIFTVQYNGLTFDQFLANEADMQRALQWLDELGIDVQNVRADIREWQSMDRAWRDHDELVALMSTLSNQAYHSVPLPRDVPRPTAQPPGPTARPEGFAQVPHGTYYYRNPNPDTIAFWEGLIALAGPTRNAWVQTRAAFDQLNGDNMARLGRVAMFAADRRLYGSLDAANQTRVDRAGRMHSLATALRSAINCRVTMGQHVTGTYLPWPAPIGRGAVPP